MLPCSWKAVTKQPTPSPPEKARGEIDLLIPRGSPPPHRLCARQCPRTRHRDRRRSMPHILSHLGRYSYRARHYIQRQDTPPGVCNSLDCLLVDRSRLGDLPAISATTSPTKTWKYMPTTRPTPHSAQRRLPAPASRLPKPTMAANEARLQTHPPHSGRHRRGSELHCSLRLQTQRVHHRREHRSFRALPCFGRCSMRVRQRVDSLHRRRPVRLRRRNRHLHTETSRPRPYGFARNHHL